MKRDRVLIDSSVWIEYFKRGKGTLSEKVDFFLQQGEVFVPKIVLAELIQGSKSKSELNFIKEFTLAVNIIGEEKDTWDKAGNLAYELKSKGKNINLADCYIAIIAMENNLKIFTLDEHFRIISKFARVELF